MKLNRGLRKAVNCMMLRDVASKSADNVAEWPPYFIGLDESGDRIGRDAVCKVLRPSVHGICNESRRFFGELAIPQEMVNASKVDDWLIRYCRREGVQ